MNQLELKFDTKTEQNFFITTLIERLRAAKTAKKREAALIELFVYLSPYILTSVSRRVKPCDQADYLSELWLVWDNWVTRYISMLDKRTKKGEKTMGILVYLRGRTISLSNQVNSKYRMAFSVSRDAYVSLAQKIAGVEIGNKNGAKLVDGLCDNDSGEVCISEAVLAYTTSEYDMYSEVEFNDCCAYLSQKLGDKPVAAARQVLLGDSISSVSETTGVTVRAIHTVLRAIRVLLR